MSRRRYFEEQRSGNGAIYHCVEVDCMTYAKDTSLYSNNSFFVFV